MLHGSFFAMQAKRHAAPGAEGLVMPHASIPSRKQKSRKRDAGAEKKSWDTKRHGSGGGSGGGSGSGSTDSVAVE